MDKDTIAVYDAKAAEYDDIFFAGQAGAHLKRFMGMLPAEGHVLDLGCGPGNAAALMQAEGFRMTCTDASSEMVERAKARGLDAQVATFDEIAGDGIYDGVWANFSLLHADRAALPGHLAALSRAMAPGAAFHIGMKVGTDAARDKIGRLYTYVGVDELRGLLADAGISSDQVFEFSEVGMAGTEDPCVIIQGRKNG